jgi:regulator of replication initiation timing
VNGILLVILVAGIIALLIAVDTLRAALRQVREEIADLLAENSWLRYGNERLTGEVATLNATNDYYKSLLDDANAQLAGQQERPAVTCPCAEMLTARDRISYLHQRNEKLTVDALGNNVRQYIKINKN